MFGIWWHDSPHYTLWYARRELQVAAAACCGPQIYMRCGERPSIMTAYWRHLYSNNLHINAWIDGFRNTMSTEHVNFSRHEARCSDNARVDPGRLTEAWNWRYSYRCIFSIEEFQYGTVPLRFDYSHGGLSKQCWLSCQLRHHDELDGWFCLTLDCLLTYQISTFALFFFFLEYFMTIVKTMERI